MWHWQQWQNHDCAVTSCSLQTPSDASHGLSVAMKAACSLSVNVFSHLHSSAENPFFSGFFGLVNQLSLPILAATKPMCK